MEGVVIFIALMAFVVLWISILCVIEYKGQKATIRVKEGDRTLTSAPGSSVDDALKNLFDKLYNQVQSLTKPEAIQRRIDQMNSAMQEAERRVSMPTREYCMNLLAHSKAKKRKQDEVVGRQYAMRQIETRNKAMEKKFEKLCAGIATKSSLAKLAENITRARDELPSIDINYLSSGSRAKYIAIEKELDSKGVQLYSEFLNSQFAKSAQMDKTVR